MPDAIQVQPRTVLGKDVKKLRREGVIPASVYGRGVESVAIQLDYIAARDMMNAHGYNTLLNLSIEGEAKPRPVVVKKVDQHPVDRTLRHIDFLQVDLTRKITGPVPVHFTGEAPAIVSHGGVLVIHADSVEVEALPADMPEAIEVSLDGLEELDSYLYASEIKAVAGVTVISPDDFLLAAINRPRLIVEGEADEIVEGEQEEGETAVEGEVAESGDAEAGESSETAAE